MKLFNVMLGIILVMFMTSCEDEVIKELEENTKEEANLPISPIPNPTKIYPIPNPATSLLPCYNSSLDRRDQLTVNGYPGRYYNTPSGSRHGESLWVHPLSENRFGLTATAHFKVNQNTFYTFKLHTDKGEVIPNVRQKLCTGSHCSTEKINGGVRAYKTPALGPGYVDSFSGKPRNGAESVGVVFEELMINAIEYYPDDNGTSWKKIKKLKAEVTGLMNIAGQYKYFNWKIDICR